MKSGSLRFLCRGHFIGDQEAFYILVLFGEGNEEVQSDFGEGSKQLRLSTFQVSLRK
jgi:hypothetical protein